MYFAWIWEVMCVYVDIEEGNWYLLFGLQRCRGPTSDVNLEYFGIKYTNS